MPGRAFIQAPSSGSCLRRAWTSTSRSRSGLGGEEGIRLTVVIWSSAGLSGLADVRYRAPAHQRKGTQMPFFDTPLKQAVAYNINVDNSTGGKVSFTILKINRRDKLA